MLDCVSLLFTTLFLLAFLVYIYKEKEKTNIPVSYYSDSQAEATSTLDNSNIFASKNGKTYTFSWCQGANRILDKNRVYYVNEEEAKRAGKMLSKLCQK